MSKRWWATISASVFVAGSATVASGETTPDFASMLLKNGSLLSNPPASCDAKASLNTFELQQCSAVAFKVADAALNDAFQAAVRSGDAMRNAKLKQAQRLWLQWRNVECDWESSRYAGGTLAPVVMGHCLVDITRARTKALQSDLEP